MDCQTFDASLLDALYDELDPRASAAIDEHAKTCDACRVRAVRLQRTRELIQPGLETAVPDGFEARILAAAESAMAAPLLRAAPVSLAERRERRERSGVVAFLSRPYFAVAASVVLVLGAATLFLAPASKRAPSTAAAPARAPQGEAPLPAFAAASVAPPAPPAEATSEPAPVATATAVAAAAAPAAPHAAPAKAKAGPASLAATTIPDAGALVARAAASGVPVRAAKPAKAAATATADTLTR